MKQLNPDLLSVLIRSRRAVFPPQYNGKPIEKAVIEAILENANWAPTHRLTQPWRFKVFRGEALTRLGKFLADHYQKSTPAAEFSEFKYKKKQKNAERSSCVIAICMQRDTQERIPEWEEIAAVSCAIQNMWLSATAHGIGAYWSTPSAIYDAGSFLGLKTGERCLGFFFMGFSDLMEGLKGERTPVEEKIEWLDV